VTNLTPHFTLEEFTDSQTAARNGVHNVPKEGSQARENLQRLAETMERVRTILNNAPILISSGYRAPKVNAMVGGSKNSKHMSGLAADFTCPGFGAPLAICDELEDYMIELEIDQLIHEFETWVHLGLCAKDMQPRHQTLTIDTKGTRHGF
jgi:zinc D-Ala-D-Ala carboxypeptidase